MRRSVRLVAAGPACLAVGVGGCARRRRRDPRYAEDPITVVVVPRDATCRDGEDIGATVALRLELDEPAGDRAVVVVQG